MTLNDTKIVQDKLFDEKFLPKTFDSYQGWTIQDFDEVTEYIRSRDLAIENAIRAQERAEVAEKIKELEQWKNGSQGVWVLRAEVLNLLTTSPSR